MRLLPRLGRDGVSAGADEGDEWFGIVTTICTI